MNKCNKNGIKREGESCTLNNNCIYPNCKIPTAESLLQAEDCALNDSYRTDYIVKKMKEFAKLHVEAAIKECIESAPSGSSTDTVSYEDVVKALKDCYPLNNIK